MKRLFAILFCLVCAFGARAGNNNTATSKNYVDTQVATLQYEIPAINSNTVLTHTGTSGEIGAKQIYDSNNDFVTQTDALVTAETFNTAVQNAIDTEFVCIDWLGEHVPVNCLLWKIQNKTPQQIVPDGYTQLEYLESTGKQYINTEAEAKPGTAIKAKFQIIGTPPTTQTDIGLLGAYETPATRYYLYLYTLNTYLNIRTFIGATYRNISIQDHNIHTLEVFSNGDYYLDGVLKGTNIYQLSISCTKNIGIFRVTTPNSPMASIASRFYSVQIDNGTVSRNFIPARRNSDGELGMYDTISGTFFTNSGTGTFIAGPDVSSNIYLPSGN